ncbi:MAG: NADH-quinone oxidoreductase subunit J [Nitrospinota bacterium]
MELLAFYILGAGAVVTAVMMVIHRNPIVSALNLIFTMFCLSGIFVLLNAHFMAAIQILVYAGAIMVLFIFVIMLLNLRGEDWPPLTWKKLLASFIGILLVGYSLIKIIDIFRGSMLPIAVPLAEDFGTTRIVGEKLFTDFLLPFEVTSILLLTAIVGAVMLAKMKIDKG